MSLARSSRATASESEPESRDAPPRLRMKDLCAETGLSRQAIHFYIQAGLLPVGDKTGKNMAWYGPEHVERLHLIRKLQEERFLPLKAIRALLDGDTDELPEPQRNLLAEVSGHLPASVVGAPPRGVPVREAAARFHLEPGELERMIDLGLVPVRPGRGDDADREIASESLWLLDLWSQFRAAGFTQALGWTVDDLLPFASAADALVAHETELLFARMSHVDPKVMAPMIEKALPLAHATLLHFHNAAIRAVFAQVAANRTRENP